MRAFRLSFLRRNLMVFVGSVSSSSSDSRDSLGLALDPTTTKFIISQRYTSTRQIHVPLVFPSKARGPQPRNQRINNSTYLANTHFDITPFRNINSNSTLFLTSPIHQDTSIITRNQIRTIIPPGNLSLQTILIFQYTVVHKPKSPKKNIEKKF